MQTVLYWGVVLKLQLFVYGRNKHMFKEILFHFHHYPNDPMFSDRYACANSADPDQTAVCSGSTLFAFTFASFGLILIRVYTVCLSVCIVWTRYSMVEPHSSNFRAITTNCLGVQIFRKVTVYVFVIRQCPKCID